MLLDIILRIAACDAGAVIGEIVINHGVIGMPVMLGGEVGGKLNYWILRTPGRLMLSDMVSAANIFLVCGAGPNTFRSIYDCATRDSGRNGSTCEVRPKAVP
jgi:hypothetical protein